MNDKRITLKLSASEINSDGSISFNLDELKIFFEDLLEHPDDLYVLASNITINESMLYSMYSIYHVRIQFEGIPGDINIFHHLEYYPRSKFKWIAFKEFFTEKYPDDIIKTHSWLPSGCMMIYLKNDHYNEFLDFFEAYQIIGATLGETHVN